MRGLEELLTSSLDSDGELILKFPAVTKITLYTEKYTACTNQTGGWESTRGYLDEKCQP